MDPSDLELVRGVRATPALFNPTNSDFKFAHRKEKIWVELSQYLGINMNDARRRWTCLRDRYTRELKNRRLNPNLDYMQDEFFKEMDFLRPYVRKRKERRSIVCKIKTDTSWDGKLEKLCYSTCDSNYSTSKLQSTKNENDTIEEINMEEIFQDYAEEKVDVVSVATDSNHKFLEEPEEESLICEENIEEYQVSEENPTNKLIQNCEIITDRIVVPSPQTIKTTNHSKSIENNETEDDFFCKSVCVYLRQLNRVHKIKAKVEMFKILQKYIEIEEAVNV